MGAKVLIPAFITFLHDFFTVVWIGGLAFMVLVLVPALKNDDNAKSFLPKVSKLIMAEFRPFVIVSIIVLIATGLFLSQRSPYTDGFMRFVSPYTTALSIKHIFMVLMLVIVVFKKAIKQRLKNIPMLAITVVNLVLGTGVLFLSALTSAIASVPK